MAEAANSRSEAEIRDILRNVVKGDIPPAGGLGTEIAVLFKGIGLREGEEIQELHGYSIRSPSGDAAII